MKKVQTQRDRVAAAWHEEIVRRVEQVREGQVETESWAEVQAKLDDALSGE